MADFRKLKDIRNKMDKSSSEQDDQIKKDVRKSIDDADISIERKWGYNSLKVPDDEESRDWAKEYKRILSEKRNEIPRFHGQLDKTVTGDEPAEDVDKKAKMEALKKLQGKK